MATLFTYCLPYDDGAAPNPFWGICTLTICKPVIRRAAKVGDWVVGIGAVSSPIGNIRGTVVYAMKVTAKMTMQEYDAFTTESLREKIPDWQHLDVRRRLGDSIYDFSRNPPRMRHSVHNDDNRERDLSGKYALLSDHFFYFGDAPVPLPYDLQNIVKQGQGHRGPANTPYFNQFVEWIHGLGYVPNILVGKPQYNLFGDGVAVGYCAGDTCRHGGDSDTGGPEELAQVYLW